MSEPTAATVLASFCADLSWSDLEAEVQVRTKELLLDHLGVAVRGCSEASSAPVVEFVQGMQAGGPSTVVGSDFCTAPAWAALANGTAAHAI